MTLLLALLASPVAWAEAFGEVSQIWEVSAGEYDSVSASSEAERIRGQIGTHVSRGLDIELGDTVRTEAAHVVVGLEDGGQVHVEPAGEYLAEGPGRIVLLAGKVYAWLRKPFEVKYETVTLSTSGTVFLAEVDEQGTFSATVQQGEVKVEANGKTVRVGRGETVHVPAGGVPAVAALATAAQLGRLRALKGRVAPRTVSAGVLVDVGTTGTGGSAGTMAFAGLRLVGSFEPLPWMVTDASVGLGRGGAGRIPVDAGVGYKLGRVAVGGQLSSMVTRVQGCEDEGGTQTYTRVYWGGHGYGRLRLPLTPWLDLEARVEAGYLDGLSVDGAGGLLLGI